MKRHPERTLKGQLNLMTQDRDYLKAQTERYLKLFNETSAALKAKEERFISYKSKADRQFQWYRQVIQELLTKLPGGAR